MAKPTSSPESGSDIEYSRSYGHQVLLGARKLRNRVFPTTFIWRRGLNSELKFWYTFFATKGLGSEGFERRLDRDSVLQDATVISKLDLLPPQDKPIRILDVGAGPVTNLGRIYKGRRLSIVAVDCLADRYNEILETFDIQPDVRSYQCESERLLELVEPDSFDLVFSRNAIDHGYDPMLSIFNMLKVVKQHCSVVLKHGFNEAEKSDYSGLHQWNFATENGRLVLWKPGRKWDVAAELKDHAMIKSFMEQDWLVSVCERL
jgi:SAM-dependent methyltransferase